jgi:hypothetical protein
LTGNHRITSTGGGQIDVGNAFTTNTVAVISGNTVLNGGGVKTGGLELGGGTFTVTGNTIRNHGSGGIGIGHNVIGATVRIISSQIVARISTIGTTHKTELGFMLGMARQRSSFQVTGASTTSRTKRKHTA